MTKIAKKIVMGLGVVLILFALIFILYVSDYNHADDNIQSLITNTITTEGNYTLITPPSPSDKTLIFYPGGKVEAIAYLPLLDQIASEGINVILVKMPFNLAVFNTDAADDAYALLPETQTWYIGGHSLGGAMASAYASEHQDKIDGLILLGAYVYGDFPKSKALTLYGSEDLVLDQTKVDYTENVHRLEGANHAGFGNYGPQKGDGEATISSQVQQREAVAIIKEFIDE